MPHLTDTEPSPLLPFVSNCHHFFFSPLCDAIDDACLHFYIYICISTLLSVFLNFFEILPKSSLTYHFYWATFQENKNFYSQCHGKSGSDDEKCFFSTGTSIDGRQGWQILYFGMCTQFSLSI